MAKAPSESASTNVPSPRAAREGEIRLATLRRDACRPKAELLDEAMQLSRFTVELAAAGKRAKK
jgi:hypothetical protein